MKQKTRTKALSWLFSLAMVLSLLPGLSSTAKAAEAEDATWSENQNITADAHIGKLTVTANVTVTITEGKTVTVDSGVDATGHTLTVTGGGSLIVEGPDITEEGQQPDPCIKGNLTVDSGTVEVTGGTGGIIGGFGIVGHLIVNSGTVTVTGGSGTMMCGHGIGGANPGYDEYASSITVNGGTVTVKGGSGSSGGCGVSSAEVTVSGGSFTAIGGNTSGEYNGGNGVYGKVTVSGGSFTAIGGNASGEDSTAIGGIGVNGDVIVSGGSFTATGGAGQTPGQAVYEDAEITWENGAVAEESDNGSTWEVIDGDSSTKQYVRVTTPSTYTLNIPSELKVANSGWNATDGISATGYLASGKVLTVTATSGDEFALVNQSDDTKKVNYKLAASGDTNTTYANATEKTSWEFKTLSETAATQTMGVVVADYTDKPAGTYQDTVTFTAKVEDARYNVNITASYMNSNNPTIIATSGNLSQTGVMGAMETVTVQISEAMRTFFHFNFSDITSNGVTAHCVDGYTATVSGTPTGDVNIQLPLTTME